ncbi:enoyl-CoA hydratase/isomerase family protein [Halobacillus salinarum]|uniref:3-hydroxyisobutyryl-CoA hydrolase n=1 Tax=Halobacillus salinarum TaxID=2932257 RepID=A0ABY4EQ40_9BACI|nr:enoyl-CoA hydratase/isomerase family protein [Halobacillus salinarum]UOQ45749.1 enoyl-CoA hydratase/isomerase family protein [Halobacillus salinarum]
MYYQVLFSQQENGVASITLNRQEALHSLNDQMLDAIGKQLMEWERNDQVKLIVLKGAGTKGLCAGGDIKTLYKARSSQEAMEKAVQFFQREYEVDELVYSYSKPIIACLDGIVMGGGVGLSYGADYRIVTEKTKWAMPEMNIGFFPDVGAAYFLNRAPGYTGRYLALTASILKAEDVIYSRAADDYMTRDTLEKFLAYLEEIDWHQLSVDDTLQKAVEQFAAKPPQPSQLKDVQEEIDLHFSKATVEEIVDSLQNSETDFARKTRDTILSKSPSSVKVTLKQLIKGEGKSLSSCLDEDFTIAKNFLLHDDFYEGIRSVLIDKDHEPEYKYQNLSEVSDETVRSFFVDRNPAEIK